MLQQVFDLDCDVIRYRPMSRVERLDDAHGVRRSVEEIRIAKGDVLRAGADLRGDVGQYHLGLDDAELSVVDRNDWAMATPMPAAAARFGVTGYPARAVAESQRRIPIER